MHGDRFYLLMFLSILAALGYLTYAIFEPFLNAITWAVVFCIVFYPVYTFTLRFIRMKALASLVTLIMILVVIIGPLSYLSFAIVSETRHFVAKPETFTDIFTSFLTDERVAKLIQKLQQITGLELTLKEAIIKSVTKSGEKIVTGFSSGFGNVLSAGADFIFMILAIFFFLKDGSEFLHRIKTYLPFSEHQRDRLTTQVQDMVVSTIYGGIIVAIVQGILGGISFAILGIGSPVLWGSIMSLTSFIPMIGTTVIWLPASVVLILKGAYLKGIILVLIGFFIISMADNFLRPLIIGGRTKMPTVVIFFAVLGGIKAFGFVGLVMGPLVVALFLSVFEIFRTIEGGIHA